MGGGGVVCEQLSDPLIVLGARAGTQVHAAPLIAEVQAHLVGPVVPAHLAHLAEAQRYGLGAARRYVPVYMYPCACNASMLERAGQS